jgi:hypothetical protein
MWLSDLKVKRRMSISADDFEQKIESVRRKLTLLEENGKVIGKRQDRIDSLALDFLSRWQNFMTQRLNVFNFNLQVKVGKRKFSLALKVIFMNLSQTLNWYLFYLFPEQRF